MLPGGPEPGNSDYESQRSLLGANDLWAPRHKSHELVAHFELPSLRDQDVSLKLLNHASLTFDENCPLNTGLGMAFFKAECARNL